MSVDSSSSITLPTKGTLARTGYTFGGWNTNNTGTGTSYSVGASYMVTGNVTLCARWIPIYTVTFNGNSATSGSIAAMSVDSGSATILPDKGTLVRTGYSFGGWNTNISGTGTNYPVGSSYIVVSTTTLYAKWTAYPVYTVTYNGNGTTIGVPPSAVNVDSGTTITLPTMTRIGYSLGGWNTNIGGIGTNYTANSSYIVTGNITLYARWMFTVTFSGNGVTIGVPPAVNVDSGSTIALPTMTRSGYSFGGWNTNIGGTGTNYSDNFSYMVMGNATLYAKWMFIDIRDGKIYKTVTIGNQTWMAENLNVETADSWCYLSSADSCAKYGRLYTWAAAKTACPTEWHLPSRGEWNNLVTAAGGYSTAGSKLKSSSGWNYYSGISSTDEFGFSALPGGYRFSDGSFYYAGNIDYWWTSEEFDSGYAYSRVMGYGGDIVDEYSRYKSYGLSVRCVED